MGKIKIWLLTLLLGFPSVIMAQGGEPIDTENWLLTPEIIGTFILLLIVIAVAIIIIASRVNAYINTLQEKNEPENSRDFNETLSNLDQEEIEVILAKRKIVLEYKCRGNCYTEAQYQKPQD